MFGLQQHQKALRYKRLFTTPDGREVLKDLLNLCGYDQSSFNKDPYKTARNEGRREVALDILAMVRMDVTDVMETMDNM